MPPSGVPEKARCGGFALVPVADGSVRAASTGYQGHLPRYGGPAPPALGFSLPSDNYYCKQSAYTCQVSIYDLQ